MKELDVEMEDLQGEKKEIVGNLFFNVKAPEGLGAENPSHSGFLF